LPNPSTKKQWILGLRGVGDRQPFQNIIITILNHEHFSHGTSIFNRNSVIEFFRTNFDENDEIIE
jgi:hypothetical protein